MAKEREVKQWITVNHQHVPIFEGQSKAEAVKAAVEKQINADADKKEKQITENKKQADKLNGKNDEKPKGFDDRATEYVAGGSDLDKVLTKEDKQFIAENSKYTEKPLYRVEDAKFNYKAFMDEGEIKGLGGSYRSFTSDFSFFNRVLDENSDDYAGINNPVIYEVLGKKKSFDMEPYTKEYTKHFGSQHEHLLGGEFEPIREVEKTIAGKKVKVVTLRWMED